MPIAVLEKKLQAVPEQYFEQVSAFLDLLLSLPTQTEQKTERKPSGHPILGLAKGMTRSSAGLKHLPLGFLKGKAKVNFSDDWEITPEELLGL